MADDVREDRPSDDFTEDQLIEAAKGLNKDQFTRADLAEALGVKPRDFRETFRSVRDSGKFTRVGEDEEGTNLFEITDG
jgi:hypothetical protein